MKQPEFEQWPIGRLIEYANNPRKNDHAVDKTAAAIREFGFRVPILAKSDGLIVDGHLRFKAAKKLGLDSVPVILCDDMTDIQIKAFRLSVNKIAELADWDTELLTLELDALRLDGFDIGLTGFDQAEISERTSFAELQAEVDELTAPPPGKAEQAKGPKACPHCGGLL